MRNYERGYHLLDNWTFFQQCKPLQRGFKIEKISFMKMFSFPLKLLIYVHNTDTHAQRDFITDARFVLLKLSLSLFFLARVVCSWPFWSEQDLFHALSTWELLAGPWLAIMPQTVLLLLFFQTLRHVGIYHPLHSQRGLQAIRLNKKEHRPHSLWLLEFRQLFTVDYRATGAAWRQILLFMLSRC